MWSTGRRGGGNVAAEHLTQAKGTRANQSSGVWKYSQTPPVKLFQWVAKIDLEDLRQRTPMYTRFLVVSNNCKKLVGKVLCRWCKKYVSKSVIAQRIYVHTGCLTFEKSVKLVVGYLGKLLHGLWWKCKKVKEWTTFSPLHMEYYTLCGVKIVTQFHEVIAG